MLWFEREAYNILTTVRNNTLVDKRTGNTEIMNFTMIKATMHDSCSNIGMTGKQSNIVIKVNV